MARTFINYTDQVKKLRDEKLLRITDEEKAKVILQRVSYYALIGGYKQPFIDPHTRKYKDGADFNDIVNLYFFDEELRGLFFKYLCRIERRMRSEISYHFTQFYGAEQSEYLNPDNYNNTSKYRKGIAKLITMLSNMANQNTDHEYLVYQRNKYHNVQLWVLMNALTFGQISKMYEFLPQNLQGAICKEFSSIRKNEMVTFLKVLTLYRNLCAHSERLFSYRTHIAIPDTILHEKLKISKTGNTYGQGKYDLFSIVIAFRYFLPGEDFLDFRKQMRKLLMSYHKKGGNLTEGILLKYMGFPKNWTSITRYRI